MTAKNVYDLYRGLLELYSLTTNFGDRKIKLFDIQQVLKLTNETTLENDLPGNIVSYRLSLYDLFMRIN